MDINQFSVRSLAFEIRYPPAFIIWDRSGMIWSDVSKRWKKIQPRDVKPNNVRYLIDEHAELSIALETSAITIAKRDKAIDDLLPFCSFIEHHVNNTLDVVEYKRIGFREVYFIKYENIDQAVENFMSTGVLKQISGKHFGIDGKISLPECVIRFENENLGCAVRFFTQTNTATLEVPPGEEDIKSLKLERHELILDCDYYTKVSTTVGQIKIENWVRQAHQVIRRDVGVIIGGK